MSFRATLALANRGGLPQQATVFVNTTKDGLTDRLEVARVDLAPGSVRTLPLSERLEELGIAGPVQEAGLDIAYDGPPGTLLARLSSRDQSGDYSFDHPVKDPEASLRTGGSYPWRLDGGRRTVLRLKNTTGLTERAVLQLRYRGEFYTPERIVLGPWESVSLDLARLRESGEPDLRGRVLPRDAASGQLVWYGESRGALIGRAEVRNDRLGVASSFSCEPVCCGVVREEASMTPSSAEDPVGEEGYPFVAEETRRDCYGIIFGPYDMSEEAEWESTDSSVASVASAGLVSCNSGGMAGITASWESTVAYSHYPVICFAIVGGAVAGASMQVTEPTLAGPTSVTRGSNATFTIQNTIATSQISGWKFTSGSTTVQRSTNTASTNWSGTMVSSGSVSVTVVQGGQTYTPSLQVTVNPRSGFTFTAVPAQKVANGSHPQLTVPATPVPGSNPGASLLHQSYSFQTQTISGGPNHGFHYVQSIMDGSMPRSFRWVIAEGVDDSSSVFYQAQCGDYDAQQNSSGFISGAQLRANVIHHESNGQSNSHYHNYVVSQDKPSNNVGSTAESQVGAPSVSPMEFVNNVMGVLNQKHTTIFSDTGVEPCQGDSNRNHAGECEFQGSINYAPYQACP